MLEEAVSVALGLQSAWFGIVCHVAFHSTESASARLRTLCAPSSCRSIHGDRAEVFSRVLHLDSSSLDEYRVFLVFAQQVDFVGEHLNILVEPGS